MRAWCRLYSFSVSAAEPAAGQDAPVPLQGDVMFSLPARCFAASLRGKHRLDFHVGTDGKLVGMQWRFPKSLDCSTCGALAAWPQATDAKAVLPVPGEDLTTVQNLAPPGVPGLGILRCEWLAKPASARTCECSHGFVGGAFVVVPIDSSRSANARADKADAAFQGGLLPPSQAQDGPRLQPDGTAAPGGPGGKPPPKEKTFMEKNWILILGIGFLGMNLLIGKPPPSSGGQGQGQGPARPAQSVSR